MSDFAEWLNTLRLHKQQQKQYQQDRGLLKLSTSHSSLADTDIDSDDDNNTYDQFVDFSHKQDVNEDLFHDGLDFFGSMHSSLYRKRSAPIVIPTQNNLYHNNSLKVESRKLQPLQMCGNEEEPDNFHVDNASYLFSNKLQFHLFPIHSSVENDEEHEDIFQLEL